MKTEKQEFKRLGREIKISPKTVVCINSDNTVRILISIGQNHTASLIMDIEAFEALNKLEPIHIETAKEFRNKIK